MGSRTPWAVAAAAALGTCIVLASPDTTVRVAADIAARMGCDTCLAGALGTSTRARQTSAATMAASVPATRGTASSQPARGDIDGDGRSDLLQTRTYGGALYYWSMSGPQVTRQSAMHHIESERVPFAEADFNGDGRSDILLDDRRTLLLSDGAGGFASASLPAPIGGWKIIGAGDVDGDGKADVLLQYTDYHESKFAYWIMDGATVTRYSPQFDRPKDATPVARGDFTGDRRLDLVWQVGRTLSMWVGDGHGFTARPVRDVSEGWTVWGSGDVDADGRSDLLLTHRARRWLAYWTMDGATPTRYSQVFRLPGEEPLGKRYGPVTVGDYNGDGRLDIVHSREAKQELVMWLGDGTGFVEFPIQGHLIDFRIDRAFGNEGAPVRPYVAGDADGDGDADLLTFGSFSTYDAERQRYYTSWDNNHSSAPLATGDFDGDARRDLVVRRMAGDPRVMRTFMTLSNLGIEVEIQTPVPGWQIIGAADVDADGRSDLLLGEGVQGELNGIHSDSYRSPTMAGFAYWVMDHASVVRYSVGFRVDPQTPRMAARGDFDGDGRLDVVWSSALGAAEPRLQMWAGDGAGFIASPLQAPAAGWTVFDAGDVSGDGTSDLFLRNGEGLAYWMMQGTQIREYSPGMLIPPPDVIRDFTGDGRVDLLDVDTRCNEPSPVYLYIGDGRSFRRSNYGSVGTYNRFCGFYNGPAVFVR